MSTMNKIRYWLSGTGAIAVLVIVGINSLVDGAKFKEAQFTGTLVYKEEVRTSRRTSTTVLHFATDGGDSIELSLNDAQPSYLQAGDYVVKIAGEKKFAVFRDGSQRKAAGVFLDREIDPADYRPAQPQPVVAQPPAPAPVEPVNHEARIDALVAEASALWQSGDRNGSMIRAREALTLCHDHLGIENPRTIQVQRMIDGASRAGAQ